MLLMISTTSQKQLCPILKHGSDQLGISTSILLLVTCNLALKKAREQHHGIGTAWQQACNLSRMHGYYPCQIFIFWGKFFSLNIRCFAENSALAAFYGLVVTHLVAHRLTLGNLVLAIPIIYLLRII